MKGIKVGDKMVVNQKIPDGRLLKEGEVVTVRSVYAVNGAEDAYVQKSNTSRWDYVEGEYLEPVGDYLLMAQDVRNGAIVAEVNPIPPVEISEGTKNYIRGILKKAGYPSAGTGTNKGDTIIKDEGRKDDQGKPRAGLVLSEFALALEGVIQAGTFGASKYSDKGWRLVANAKSRYHDAMLRHYLAHAKGEELDPETGLSHLKHFVWNALAYLHFEMVEKEESANTKR